MSIKVTVLKISTIISKCKTFVWFYHNEMRLRIPKNYSKIDKQKYIIIIYIIFILFHLSFPIKGAIVPDGSFFDPHLTNIISHQQDYKKINGGFIESSTMNHVMYPDNNNNIEMESFEESHDLFDSSYIRSDDFLPPKYEEHIFDGQPASDTAKCYSCMSTFYGAVWPAINHVYKKPKNFTNKCNEDNVDSNYVPATMCSTICVHMWEDANVGGVKIKGHIRGCLDDILINGFNQTVVTWYRWMHRDSCRQYRKRELFKIPSDQSDESMVNVCTCYSDHCNSGSQVSHCSLLSLLLVLSIIIFKEILERR
ncbi:Caenorhabditis elegans ly-6-related family-containing protein [Strongyloides ratti]|uniref:Caenorhabditis elegans ly-6-related family-containing protein n=1 Tax=Strongyloides ratti TaxID=34506 RepID=A0A090L177_STRRB|nr:Caenorhabditis elegans ly-6-related family-containing protein [Strongyloides ratti]CEF63461.1 Caenorhabditis elegans ly-6-related family-containing protein [Strongyloides ratti]